MTAVEDIVIEVLRRSGLSRSSWPVQVPCAAVWPLPDDGNHTPTRRLRDDLLIAINRRVWYRRLVVFIQLAGLAGSWVGVLLPKGRVVTILGVTLALIGSILSLIDKDRLANIESRIDVLYAAYRRAMHESVAIMLEIGPYSYAHAAASGLREVDVLRSRQAELGDDLTAALIAWSMSRPVGTPSGVWAGLRRELVKLRDIDGRGHLAERRAFAFIDSLRVALLVLLLATAVGIPSLSLPDTTLATVATIVTLTARSASEGALMIFARPAPGADRETAIAHTAVLQQLPDMSISDLDENVIATLMSMSVTVPRSLVRGRQRRLLLDPSGSGEGARG